MVLRSIVFKFCVVWCDFINNEDKIVVFLDIGEEGSFVVFGVYLEG